MCGICGIYNLDDRPVDRDNLKQMAEIARHRGPDDEGFLLVDTVNGSIRHCHGNDTIIQVRQHTYDINDYFPATLGLGFRRLSILDLSSKGHQPMSNDNGTIWIVFNGEIYNYIEIREDLIKYGFKFHSNTDTEVILKAYERWGEDCLQRFNGMWSFALYDSNLKKLFCARDRFGIKPFFYYFDNSTFIFSSEIKQILVNSIDKSINFKSIQKSFYNDTLLINSGGTFFKNIQILPHSHFLTIENNELKIRRYYDLPVNNFDKSPLSFDEACSQYKEIFKDSVILRMRSDVEVGSALSGGLDSSAIVTIASGLTPRTFKTFSSYFDTAPQYDERKWIDLVNKRTNSDGHLISPPVTDFIADFEKMTWHHDYPLQGSSPMAQYYVMKLASENGVKVLLDGQGSDEMLGGYNHSFYRHYSDLIRSLKLLKFLQEYFIYLKYNKKGSIADKIIKTLLVLLFDEPTLYYYESRFKPAMLTIPWEGRKEFYPEIRHLGGSKLSNFHYNLMMSTSIQTLLHYEDRNSMAHSVESRVPFLDYRLVELAFSLPGHYKINNGLGKYIHRQAMKEFVPSEILNRKDKIGFATPGEFYWLKGEMKEMALAVLHSSDFLNRGIYNTRLIQDEFNKYLNGKQKNATLLWKVIALETWFKVFKIN